MSDTSKGTYFPSTGRWKIDNLPVSETEELTITAEVDAGTTEETITNVIKQSDFSEYLFKIQEFAYESREMLYLYKD